MGRAAGTCNSGKDGLATVTDDRVAARVGSRLSDIRDVIQVRLHRGEVVEVLDARTDRSGHNARVSNTWYKIAPPAGEFRWISGRYLDSEYHARRPARQRGRRDTGGPAAGRTARRGG